MKKKKNKLVLSCLFNKFRVTQVVTQVHKVKKKSINVHKSLRLFQVDNDEDEGVSKDEGSFEFSGETCSFSFAFSEEDA